MHARTHARGYIPSLRRQRLVEALLQAGRDCAGLPVVNGALMAQRDDAGAGGHESWQRPQARLDGPVGHHGLDADCHYQRPNPSSHYAP